MRLCFSFIITLLALAPLQAQESAVWQADMHDGQYRNPIVHADYSDPDVIRVGNDFWLTASSFTAVPGLPVLHSTDLVNWRIVNHALPVLQPADDFSTPQHGKGVWAPCMRYHNGKYYIFWGDPDRGIYTVTAPHPTARWSEPQLIMAGRGLIDPTPLWDDDGRLWLAHAWAYSRSGMNSVLTLVELDTASLKPISQPILIYDGQPDGNHTIEGTKLYKRNGYYYILAPAGGVQQGWQLALRSHDIRGPYEARRVMEQGTTDINGPHQGGWVTTPEGEDWFLHFQDCGPYGRVLHLNPMEWHNDWPVIGSDRNGSGCGMPVSMYIKPIASAGYCSPQDSDDFNSTELGQQWQWIANYRSTFGMPTPMGFFRLYTSAENQPNLWTTPNLLLQKLPARSFTATARLTITAKTEGNSAGLIVFGLDYARLCATWKGNEFSLDLITCHDAENGTAEDVHHITNLPPTRLRQAGALPNAELDLLLRVSMDSTANCSFSYCTDSIATMASNPSYTYTATFKPCVPSFKAREGKWEGAKIGFCAVADDDKNRGWADIDWFQLSK